MNISRPVLRYHGGKFGNRGGMADKIIANFPPHRVYVEPFGGAASVLMRKSRSYAEVYNDRWGGVVSVFRILRDPEKAAELERRLRLTPFAREEFELTTADNMVGLDEIEYVRRLIFRSFAGFGSAASNPAYNTGFRANSNRSGTTPAHDWANYPAMIEAFTARLRGVVIENRDAAEIIIQHDGAETLFYADPPYVHTTRSAGRKRRAEYEHEMDDDQHRALGATLNDVAGMVVLSGYPSTLYDEIYGGWRRIEFDAMADGAQRRREVLWFNPAAWSARQTPLERASA